MRSERGYASTGAAMLVVIILLVGLTAMIWTDHYQTYEIKSDVSCPGKPPLTYGPATFGTDNAGNKQLTNPSECLSIGWTWKQGGLHWHAHHADIGIYKLIPQNTTTTTTQGKQ